MASRAIVVLPIVGIGAIVVFVAMRRRGAAVTTVRKATKTPATAPVPMAATTEEVTAAVRSEGVCVMASVLDAAAVASLRTRLEEIEPRKLQNRRKHRWEHVHSPEAAVTTAAEPRAPQEKKRRRSDVPGSLALLR